MSEKSEKIHKVVIIGGGPAGLTAALYNGRANLEPLCLLGDTPGGQLSTTSEVENYPGFPEGIQGPDLMERFQAQAKRFGADLRFESATVVDLYSNPKKITTDGGEVHLAHSVIIATGANPRLLGIDGEQSYWNLGVHTCAVCDGAFYRGKTVAVVGGGDSACTDALYLKGLCEKVYMYVRRDVLVASPIMQDRVLNDPQIEVVWNTVVDTIEGNDEDGVQHLNLKNRKTGESSTQDVAAIFIAIGHDPATEVFKKTLGTDDNGYLLVRDHVYTDIDGVFAGGDVHDHTWRQAVTAAGFGCMAAIATERWLSAANLS